MTAVPPWLDGKQGPPITPSTGAQRSTAGSTTVTARSAGVCKQYFELLRRLEICRSENGQALRIFRERRHTTPGSDDRFDDSGEWSDLAGARWAALIDAHFRSDEVAATEIFDSSRVLGRRARGCADQLLGISRDEDLPDAGESKDAQARGQRLDMPSRMRT